MSEPVQALEMRQACDCVENIFETAVLNLCNKQEYDISQYVIIEMKYSMRADRAKI